MTASSTTTSPKKILIVTGDCPSHPYACVKLATVLAAHHSVQVAGPNGPALLRLHAEVKKYNESTAKTKNKIGCVSIGDVSTLVHCNVRSVINPQQYSPLKIIFNSVFNRKYSPFGIAQDFEQLMDDQIDTYDNLKQILPNYDLVYAIHTAAGTVCDAIESLQQDQVEMVPPCIIFSSLPYNSGFIYKGLVRVPRSIVALPHVATYSSPSKAWHESFFPVALISYLIQLFWMCLDTYHAERAWKLAGKRTDERRASRGLPPVYDAMRYYWINYPVLSLGGTKPFIAEGDYIADNATVVGSIQSTETSDLKRLDDWFNRAAVSKIVYASFGTGTQLSIEEATNLAKLALSLENTEYHLLLSLSKGLQERLQHVFNKAFGSKPTMSGDGFSEYKNFRIDNDVPQENLLLSKMQKNKVQVDVFVSHMGFGGYTEAVYGGVPFVAYPAGCDQWYNTERAVEAGVAVKAQPKMKNLDVAVRSVINNESTRKRSQQLASNAVYLDSNRIILNMLNEICDGETADTDSACSDASASIKKE